MAAQVPRQSAGRWFEVLEDTLLIHRSDAFAKSATRRLVQHPKFYFFDVGVLNGLLANFVASPDRIGRLFEHLVYGQIVDFVVERGRDMFARGAKASRTISATDLRGLAGFGEYVGRKHRQMVWYLGSESKQIDGVEVLPWQLGLQALGW